MNIDLEPQELDYVFSALALRPWGEVNALMGKIQQQVVAQQKLPPTEGAENGA